MLKTTVTLSFNQLTDALGRTPSVHVKLLETTVYESVAIEEKIY